jgi:hypothetical protein
MIDCPAMNVPPPSDPVERKRYPYGSQGCVSYGTCCDCKHHLGHEEKPGERSGETAYTITCGFGGKVVTLPSIPI